MRLALCANLLLVMLAGCLGGGDPDSAPAETATPGPVTPPSTGPGGVPYAVDPNDPATWDGAHTHDEWGPNTILPLFEDQVHTDDCAQMGKVVVDLLAGAEETRIQNGCAWIILEEDTLVPEGTGEVSVRLDLGGTDHHDGSITVWYANRHTRTTYLEPCAETVCEWVIPVNTQEWDIPHSERSSWGFGIEPRGQVGLLMGSIDAYVEARRIADWEPILGSAHIDHWATGAAHDFVAPGVMRILDLSVDVSQPPLSERGAGWEYPLVPLADIVPPGAREITVVYVWGDIAGCAPGAECTLEGWMRTVTSSARYRGELTEAGATSDGRQYVIYTHAVGDNVPADSTYATESQHAPQVRLKACPAGEERELGKFGDSCFIEGAMQLSATVHVEVEAWKNGADVQRLKQRLGI